MQIHDYDGIIETNNQDELVARLHSVRRGPYGVFHIQRAEAFPYISLHFNGDLAYVHYFPADDHPGYQPTSMTPPNCPGDVHFLNIDGDEAGAIDMPASTVVSTESAIQAVREFAASSFLPPSIAWVEL